MRIIIFNVKYSENLGDGLLAQCLESALSNHPDMEVETIDLAGRTAFGMTHSRRKLAIRVLHMLPAFARRLAVKAMLQSRVTKLAHTWSGRIDWADAVVIGGGNLFQDDDLNFPLKIGTLLDCISKSGKPLAIYAVGVSGHWSPEAEKLFSTIRNSHLIHLSVRDTTALGNWIQHFPGEMAPIILPDPGLLTSRFLRQPPAKNTAQISAVAGICVTDPLILARHSGGSGADIPLRSVDEYRALIHHLVEDGYRIRLFSNGAREDQQFAERLLNDRKMQAYVATNNLDLAKRPQEPAELTEILQSTSVIAAHRLHACIAAYSLAIPHVGLGWDPKVASFFDAVGRRQYFAAGSAATPLHISSQMKIAEGDHVSDTDREATLAAAAAGVEALLTVLQSVIEPSKKKSVLSVV